jgi:hypothetical protein
MAGGILESVIPKVSRSIGHGLGGSPLDGISRGITDLTSAFSTEPRSSPPNGSVRDLTFCEPAAKSGLAELRLTRPRHLETRPPLTTVQSRRRTVNIDPRQNQTESGIELQRLSSGRGPSGRSRLQRTVGRQTDYFRPF